MSGVNPSLVPLNATGGDAADIAAREIAAAQMQDAASLGAADGARNIPAEDAATLGESERAIVSRWQEALASFFEGVRIPLDRMKAEAVKSEAPAASGIASALERLRHKMEKILIEHEPQLRQRRAAMLAAKRDLDAFKSKASIEKEASYASSAIFSAGLLLCLVLIEGAVNAVLFAGASELGLLGGLLEAFMVSGANILIAFLAGYFALRQLNAPGALRKLAGVVATASCIAIIIAFNGLAAHYRDYKARAESAAQEALLLEPQPAQPPPLAAAPRSLGGKPGAPAPRPALTAADEALAAAEAQRRALEALKRASDLRKLQRRRAELAAEKQAIDRIAAAPFDLQSFDSFILFFAGLACAALALWKGYALDDPVPGYGRLDRTFKTLRRDYFAARQPLMLKAHDIWRPDYAAAMQRIEEAAATAQALRGAHLKFERAEKRARDQTDKFESGLHDALRQYREANMNLRTQREPVHFNHLPRLRASSLPSLEAAQLSALAELEGAVERATGDAKRGYDGALAYFRGVIDGDGQFAAPERPTAFAQTGAAMHPRPAPVRANGHAVGDAGARAAADGAPPQMPPA